MLKESFGKRKVFFHLISVLNRHFCGGRSLVFWQKVHCCCKSSQCLPAAIDLSSCRGNIGFTFSVYIACLILGFSDGTEHTATVVVALPCPLDFVLINMSSVRFGSSHDDKDLLGYCC